MLQSLFQSHGWRFAWPSVSASCKYRPTNKCNLDVAVLLTFEWFFIRLYKSNCFFKLRKIFRRKMYCFKFQVRLRCAFE